MITRQTQHTTVIAETSTQENKERSLQRTRSSRLGCLVGSRTQSE